MKKFFLSLVVIFFSLYVHSQEEKIVQTPKWRFGISGGLAYLTASSKEAERDLIYLGMSEKDAKGYYKGLKWSQTISGDIHYLFNSTMGVGLKYHLLTSSSEKKDLMLDINGDGEKELVNIKEQLYYNFIGPSFYIQNEFGKNNKFRQSVQIAIGYLHYRDETKSTTNLLGTGSTVGMNTELGIEYLLNKHWALGLDLGTTVGMINKITLDNGYQSVPVKLKGDERINMAHFHLSLGIRFYR